jgi:hypothetical protein
VEGCQGLIPTGFRLISRRVGQDGWWKEEATAISFCPHSEPPTRKL